MPELLLILVGFVGGFIAGSVWVWRIVNRAIDQFERDR